MDLIKIGVNEMNNNNAQFCKNEMAKAVKLSKLLWGNLKLRLHNWIIKKIVGKKTVVINATIYGSIWVDKNSKALISNNEIVNKPFAT